MELTHEIIIGHYHGVSLFSKLIKLRSWWKSPITHTAALTPDLIHVYEAWRVGFTCTAWEEGHHTPGTLVDIMAIPCTEKQFNKFYEACEARVKERRPYDIVGVVLGFLTRDEIQVKGKEFCTEAIELCLEAAGLRFQDRIPAHKLTPSLAYISPIQKYKCQKRTP